MKLEVDDVDYPEVICHIAFRRCSVLGRRRGLLLLSFGEDFDCRRTFSTAEHDHHQPC